MSASNPRQQLQLATGGPIVTVATFLDKETQERFVLWKHILVSFKTADHVMDSNGEVVHFMMDENYNDIIPERIEYRPGIVLKVALQDGDGLSSTPPGTASDDSMTAPFDSLDLVELESESKFAKRADTRAERAMELYASSRQSFSLALASGKTDVAQLELKSMNRCYQNLQAGVDRSLENQQMMMMMQVELNKKQIDILKLQEDSDQKQGLILTLQEKSDQKQEWILALQKDSDEKQGLILSLQEKMMGMQQEALDRLALIQGRVQALITQTYELHEYPTPRLFIVLPKDPEVWDRLNPFTHKFRLNFLCECGDHTKTPGSTISHDVHLAKHEGYDLAQPTEFFDKYGSYLLTMMEMVKYGVTAAGIVVPSLAQFGLVDSMSGMQESLKFSREAFVPLVNDTISHLQKHLQIDPELGEPGKKGTSSTAEALEGADLRQLGSFLSDKDEAKTLGNLYRIVTTEGHVKWVCLNHYRENYKESAIRQTQEVVEANGGTLNEGEGKIDVAFTSRTAARQFYSAVIKARGVHELDIYLQWDATKADLKELQAAVLQASIRVLSLNGYRFDGPAIDVTNRGSRFDPIMQIMGNGMVQSFRLKRCDRFLERVSLVRASASSCLRRLKLDISFGKPGQGLEEKLFQALRQHLTLEELYVHCDLDLEQAAAALDSIIPILPSLKILELKCEDLSLKYGLKSNMVEPHLWPTQVGESEVVPKWLQVPLQHLKLVDLCLISAVRREQFSTALDSLFLVLPSLDLVEVRAGDKFLTYHLKANKLVFSQGEYDIQWPLEEYFLLLKGLDRIVLSCQDPIMVHMGKTGPVFGLQRPDSQSTRPLTGSSPARSLPEMQSHIWMPPGTYPVLDLLRSTDESLALLETIARQQQDIVFSNIWLDLSNLSNSGAERMLDLVQHYRLSNLTLRGDPPSISEGPEMPTRDISINTSTWMNLTTLLIQTGSLGKYHHFLQPRFATRAGTPLLDTFRVFGLFGASMAAVQWITSSFLARTPEDVLLDAQPLVEVGFKGLKMETECWNVIVEAIEFTALKRLSFWESDIPEEAIDRMTQRMPQGLPLEYIDLQRAINLSGKWKWSLAQRILAQTGSKVEIDF